MIKIPIVHEPFDIVLTASSQKVKGFSRRLYLQLLNVTGVMAVVK